jgi:predicted DNA-binding transcriptional regulator AlpA
MGRRVDIDDLIDAAGVATELGLSQRNSVYVYRSRHPDFPQPVVTHGRCYLWHRGDIRRWIKTRSKR